MSETEPLGETPAAPGLPIDPYFTPLEEGDEPTAVGTIFLTMIILMVIVGVWAIVYLELLGR